MNGDEQFLYDTQQAARLLGMAPSTLTTMRSRGGGPPFIKLGRKVRYRPEALKRWVKSHRDVTSTSDPKYEKHAV